MGRPKTVGDKEGAAPAMMVYVPLSLKKAEQDVAKALGVSLSDRIRQLMTRDVADHHGIQIEDTYPYEDKEAELRKLLREEGTVETLLRKDELEGTGATAYSELHSFAVSLGSDESLAKDSDQILTKLRSYDCDGSEPFNERQLEQFIQYFEMVIKRRKLQAELKKHRKNGFGQCKVQVPIEVTAV